jgi:hypothetical protein
MYSYSEIRKNYYGKNLIICHHCVPNSDTQVFYIIILTSNCTTDFISTANSQRRFR